jgi:cation diffusion facilitator family transporter
MLSEGAHSLVDCGNEVLLLYGMRRAARPPDLSHPFGHGREVYFWSFVVALLFFALGAGVSFYEGIQHLLDPHPIEYFSVTYGVLGLSMLCEGFSLRVAVKEFAHHKGELGYVEAIRRSKNPANFTILLEDSAALTGLAIAFLGILGAQLFEMPALDGIASIGISLVLGTMAVFLAVETKGLLLGEQASPVLEAAILRAASADPAVETANGVYTVHIGPDQIVADLSLAFERAADADEIERAVQRIEAAIRAEHPEVLMLFVKPQSQATWNARLSRIEAQSSPELRASATRRRALWRKPG